MKNNLFLAIIGLIIIGNHTGCKPMEDPPIIENSPICWKQLLGEKGHDPLTSTPIYYDGKVIVGVKEMTGYFVKAWDAVENDLIWSTNVSTNIGFSAFRAAETLLIDDKVVFSSGKSVFVVDADSGELLWAKTRDNLRYGSTVIDNYVYKTEETSPSISSLYRYDIATGVEEKLFSISNSEYSKDHEPAVKMPIMWKRPNGDEILVMANRSYGRGTTGKNRLDVFAWNLTADSMLWYRENLDERSSTATPIIDGDKVYFYGMFDVYCVDAETGQTIWNFTTDPADLEGDFNTANIVIVGDKLMVKTDSDWMYAVDKETGQLRWVNRETASMPGMLTVKGDTVWFSSGGVYAIDAHTGEKYIDGWDNNHTGSWIFPVAHNPDNRLIYTSDAQYLYCLDPKYMK